MKSNITVVDAVMGTGKSTWAIKHINSNPDTRFIVVLPTLAEVERYRSQLTREVFVPNDMDTEYDLDDDGDRIDWTLQDKFRCAARDCKTILTTHRMLEVLDDISVMILHGRNYQLILDEVTNTISPIPMSKTDYQVLADAGFVTEEEERPGVMKVLNTDKIYCDYRVEKNVQKLLFGNFMLMVRLGNVRRVKEQFFIWVASADKLEVPNKVFILTYMFQGSPMDAWMYHHGLTYDLVSVEKGELVDYKPTGGKAFKDLIRVCDNPKWNDIGKHKTALSSSWMDKNLEGKVKLKESTRCFFRSLDATCDDVGWATFRKSSKELAPKGYSVRKSGLKFNPKEIAKLRLDIRSQQYCCIPLNCKGTNSYIHVRAMAILANYFSFPAQRHFYETMKAPLDEDQYALSEMVQVIWRSRIRDSREGADRTIDVYIPSRRMRELFIKWLSY